MPQEKLPPDVRAKTAAAQEAIKRVKDGMLLGLGTGSTAEIMIRLLAERIRKERLSVECLATSQRSAALAQELGISVIAPEGFLDIDLTIDGADEIDPSLSLIKGGGGALLREKIVSWASDEMIVIADESKKVDCLGTFPLPVEVTPFCKEITAREIAYTLLGLEMEYDNIYLRAVGKDDMTPFVTDGGNFIFDIHLIDGITDPYDVELSLCEIPGVVDCGLFNCHCSEAIIGMPDGSVEILVPALDPDEEDEA